MSGLPHPNKRRVCIFSGKRGGFGAYVPLMELLSKDPSLDMQIFLADMHASEMFGRTAHEAYELFPSARIELVEMGTGRGDTAAIRAENLGIAFQRIVQALITLKPDLVMVHGDRGEHLVTAFAALTLGIPVTHSQGGEVSGNIDEIQRHAITKLACLHFPETEKAAERIRRLGEEDWRIHVVGSLYIDRIVNRMYTDAPEARRKYSLGEYETYGLAILHPETFKTTDENYLMARAMFAALEETGIRTIVVYPCSDPGYQGIIQAIDEVRNNPLFSIHKNIGNLDFLGLMSSAAFLIGNSSSALVEAPYFHMPAVIIGKRQEGRDREENVIDCNPMKEEIVKSLLYAMKDNSFKKTLKSCGYRLGDGRASEKILLVLKNISLDKKLLQKRMTY